MADLARIRYWVHNGAWSSARAAASGDAVALEYVRQHCALAPPAPLLPDDVDADTLPGLGVGDGPDPDAPFISNDGGDGIGDSFDSYEEGDGWGDALEGDTMGDGNGCGYDEGFGGPPALNEGDGAGYGYLDSNSANIQA